jgi:hypothetical protein
MAKFFQNLPPKTTNHLVFVQILRRMHRDCPAVRQQGVPDVPQEAGVQTIPQARPEFRSAGRENISKSRRVRGAPRKHFGVGHPKPQSEFHNFH